MTGGFADVVDFVAALVQVVVLVAVRIVAGLLRFAGTYPKFTAAAVGLWYVVEVAQ